MTDENSEAAAAVQAWLTAAEGAFADGDSVRLADLVHQDSYWRDLVALTWNLVTVQGPDGVCDMLGQTLADAGPHGLALATDMGQPSSDRGLTQGWFTFQTRVGRGVGHVRLRDGKAWTVLTALQELTGHEETTGARRPRGAAHGADPGRRSWSEVRRDEEKQLGYSVQPYTLIIGGGQGGIALGARLRHLGVPAIIIDRQPRPGDNWRSRYKTLALHDPVWHNHLPYLDFPSTWPVFTPKDKLGDWLEMYVKVMELNFWGSTECKSASYDEAAQRWRIVVEREGVELELSPAHVVLAMGVSGKPSIPRLAGAEVFRGDQQHSSQHPGPDAYRGKRAVVVGSNNSAHDVCAALWEGGAHVTMVQRSSTLIVRSQSLIEYALDDLYSEEAVAAGRTVGKADLINASVPYGLLPEFQRPLWDKIRENDAEFYASLERVGFALDFGEDNSGLYLKYLRRGSGYYIDVGASELVASGQIHLESPADIVRLTEHQVELSNGAVLDADLVVYATGYEPMSSWLDELISPEVARKVGKVWGLGSGTAKDPGPWEGELRNMYKPTPQAGLWFHGGNLYQSRQYSLYLALQLKARYEGMTTPVYRGPS